VRSTMSCGVAALLAACAGVCGDVFPTTAHVAFNVIPFGSNQTATMHQVFASTLFSTATGGAPARIERISFAPGVGGTYTADITIRLGYTDRTPGVAPPIGLDLPVPGSPGVPNATGTMATFYANPAFNGVFSSPSTSNFQMQFSGTPFVYDPSRGNLLVEIDVVVPGGLDLSVSRASGGPESSRAYVGNRFNGTSPTQALRMEFIFTAVTGGCYPNCDESTTAPVLNVQDFTCFLQRYAAGESYANCDESTVAPVLNVQDFTCFLQSYAAGCP
jgi:hypothetical protein